MTSKANLIGPDGRRRWLSAAIGPEITALAAADLTLSGHPQIFAGVDSGDLLAFDRRGKQLWRTNLGDRITALLPVDLASDGGKLLICAAESATVFAVRKDGSLAWRCPLPDGAGGAAAAHTPAGWRLAVAAGDAGLVLLDSSGRLVAHGPTASRATAVTIVGQQAIITTAHGTLEAFSLNRPR